MRLIFVADGRSPTTLNWLKYWVEKGHQVHLVSTYPCDRPSGLASLRILPVAFSRIVGSSSRSLGATTRKAGSARGLRTTLLHLRYYLGPLTLSIYRPRLLRLVSEIQPDLVHAMRIPFEGMLAATLPAKLPLLVSIWGNDITLHATGSILMGALTRKTLKRTDGLLADTERDIRLAREWGYSNDKPFLVVPGAGGIDADAIAQVSIPNPVNTFPEKLPDAPIVVNARGQRPGSLRQDVFFQSIPLVLEKFPQTIFVCPSLAGEAESEKWVQRLGIETSTRLWPRLTRQEQLWGLFLKSQLFVSPSIHDGTPNSLLEAMACGCFPVVGNIESMREWIQPGINGLLVDANSPQSLAEAMIKALGDSPLRETARIKNAHIIAERADYRRCMAMVEAFYGNMARK